LFPLPYQSLFYFLVIIFFKIPHMRENVICLFLCLSYFA
jgi:hypothetical protein